MREPLSEYVLLVTCHTTYHGIMIIPYTFQHIYTTLGVYTNELL